MENNISEGRFLKIANIVILVALLATVGLLAVVNLRLNRELDEEKAAAAAISQLPAAVAPAPSPAPAPAPVPAAAAPAPRKPAAATVTKRNYTQAEKQLPVANPVEPEPAPAPEAFAQAAPTNRSPGPPLPFPPTEQGPPPRPQPVQATIPSGTMLAVRLLETLNTDRNQAGDRFRASLEDAIVIDGNVAVPRGTTVEGRLLEAQQAGRVNGVAQFAMELSQLRLPSGEAVVLQTDTVTRQGQTSTGQDAAKVGAGAAIGAAIGAIAGGGKGAAIGAATGAGAGTAGVLLSRGQPLILSPETVLSFQLISPVTLEVVPGQASDVSYSTQQRIPPSPDDWNANRPRLRRRPSGRTGRLF